MTTVYNVLIIGAGNIGAFYDNPNSDKILSHAHAYTKHKGFNLVGFIDVDQEKSIKATAIWGGKAFKDIESALDIENSIDIAVVGVPDDFHFNTLRELSKYDLKVIVIEKPITKTLAEAKEIIKIFNSKKTKLLVNYSRRFVPEFEKIKTKIEAGTYGEYLTGTGYYGKGIAHNGSHMVDLLRYFIGEIKEFNVINSVTDFYEDDKTVSAVLQLGNKKPFYLQGVDCRKYTVFEMDLLFENKRIRICDLGFKLEEYDVFDSSVYNGYQNIVKVSEKSTSLDHAIFNAAENLYNFLSQNQSLKCNLDDGFKALETSLKIQGKVNLN